MRYNDFKSAFQHALNNAGLLPHQDRPRETIETSSMDRRFEVNVGLGLPQRAEPFLVTAEISFRWDPFESARTFTQEEDLVTELFDRDEDLPKTMQRHLRVDLVLRAMLPYGSKTPMPESKVLADWADDVDLALEEHLPNDVPMHDGRIIAVMACRSGVEVKSRCEDGSHYFSGVQLPSWQAVVPPRVLDDPEEPEEEGDIEAQLEGLAGRFRAAFDEWMKVVGELRSAMGAPQV